MAAEGWARGKVLAVTGGAGGLGAAFGRRFAAAGARVALLDLFNEGRRYLAPLSWGNCGIAYGLALGAKAGPAG